jgi:thioester reductase-like protein
MDQFRLNMNFLGIKQILVIIFTLKINFYIYLSTFSVLWTMHQKQRSAGVIVQYYLDSEYSHPGLRVDSIIGAVRSNIDAAY